jgi:hypothetical protein
MLLRTVPYNVRARCCSKRKLGLRECERASEQIMFLHAMLHKARCCRDLRGALLKPSVLEA